VVGRLGQSTLESITELRDQLVNFDAPTLGVVVNSDAPVHDGNRYYL
jgi:hypothetical protein